MSARKLNSYDGIGTWKRRPIRASKKTYMPSHKRWGKVITMPVPQGNITTSNIWTGEPLAEGEKNYKVTFHSHRETIITANSKEDALMRAKVRVAKNEDDYNSFFQNFDEEIEEL